MNGYLVWYYYQEQSTPSCTGYNRKKVWDYDEMDVKSAFLLWHITEEVYVKQLGFDDPAHPNKSTELSGAFSGPASKPKSMVLLKISSLVLQSSMEKTMEHHRCIVKNLFFTQDQAYSDSTFFIRECSEQRLINVVKMKTALFAYSKQVIGIRSEISVYEGAIWYQHRPLPELGLATNSEISTFPLLTIEWKLDIFQMVLLFLCILVHRALAAEEGYSYWSLNLGLQVMQGYCYLSMDCDFQGTVELHALLLSILKFPMITPTDESQTSGGDERTFDIYAIETGKERKGDVEKKEMHKDLKEKVLQVIDSHDGVVFSSFTVANNHLQGFDLVLDALGDLTLIWETAESSDDVFRKDQKICILYQRVLMIRMLDHGMEVEDETEDSHHFDTLFHLVGTMKMGDNS
ncbi:hypothetical protein Tco_0233895 [Tanacetum coccineum]